MLSFHKWSITDFSYLLAPREHKNPLLVLMMFGWCSKTLSETTIRVLTDSMIFTRFSFFCCQINLLNLRMTTKNRNLQMFFQMSLCFTSVGTCIFLKTPLTASFQKQIKGIDSHCPLLHRCLCFIPESILVLHHHDNIHHDNILQNLLWTTVIVMLH